LILIFSCLVDINLSIAGQDNCTCLSCTCLGCTCLRGTCLGGTWLAGTCLGGTWLGGTLQMKVEMNFNSEIVMKMVL